VRFRGELPAWVVVAANIVAVAVFCAVSVFVTPTAAENAPAADQGNNISHLREPVELNVLPLSYGSQKPVRGHEKEILARLEEAVKWYTDASPDGVTPFTIGAVYPAFHLPVATGARGGNICDRIEQLAQKQSETLRGVVLVLASGATPCSYSGLAQMNGEWLIAYGWRPVAEKFPTGTVIHELGHILGLSHAESYTCPSMTDKSDPVRGAACARQEYGDETDPMGRTGIITDLGFGPVSLEKLGWEGKENYAIYANEGTFNIDLRAGETITLPGGHLLSSRKAHPRLARFSYHDTPEDRNYDGVYLYQVTDENSVVIPFTKFRQHGLPGDHYVDRVNNFAFTITGTNDHVQGVVLHISNDARDVWGPSVKVLPASYAPSCGVTQNFIVYALDYSGIDNITTTDSKQTRVHAAEDYTLTFNKKMKEREIVIVVEDKAGNLTRTVGLVGALNAPLPYKECGRATNERTVQQRGP
jgi:hypothetical protein